jgi:hypothetical protein
LYVAQHLTKQMPPGSWLYRWSGPALLGLRVTTDDHAYDEHLWTQIASKHIEKTIESERRSALVRVTLACTVQFAEPGVPLDTVLKQLDDFAASVIRD